MTTTAEIFTRVNGSFFQAVLKFLPAWMEVPMEVSGVVHPAVFARLCGRFFKVFLIKAVDLLAFIINVTIFALGLLKL